MVVLLLRNSNTVCLGNILKHEGEKIFVFVENEKILKILGKKCPNIL